MLELATIAVQVFIIGSVLVIGYFTIKDNSKGFGHQISRIVLNRPGLPEDDRPDLEGRLYISEVK